MRAMPWTFWKSTSTRLRVRVAGDIGERLLRHAEEHRALGDFQFFNSRKSLQVNMELRAS